MCWAERVGEWGNEILRGWWAQKAIEILYIRESLTPCTKNYALQYIAKKCMHTYPSVGLFVAAKMHCNLFSFFSECCRCHANLKCSRLFSSKIKTEKRGKNQWNWHIHARTVTKKWQAKRRESKFMIWEIEKKKRKKKNSYHWNEF